MMKRSKYELVHGMKPENLLHGSTKRQFEDIFSYHISPHFQLPSSHLDHVKKKKAAVCCRSVTAAIQFGNKKTISSLYNIGRHAEEGPINRQFSNIVRSLPSAKGPFGYVVDHKICHIVYTLLSSLKYLYFCNLERSKSIVESICTFTSLPARC